jgi:hypothetical protein
MKQIWAKINLLDKKVTLILKEAGRGPHEEKEEG